MNYFNYSKVSERYINGLTDNQTEQMSSEHTLRNAHKPFIISFGLLKYDIEIAIAAEKEEYTHRERKSEREIE